MKRSKPISAGELMATLESDQDFLGKRREAEVRRLKDVAAFAEEERDLLVELSNAGISVDSVWDFVSCQATPEAAIPVLISHLSAEHSDRIMEGIVRSLTDVTARPAAAGPLIKALKAARGKDDLSFAIINALSVVADERSHTDVSKLIYCKELKKFRAELIEIARKTA